MSVHNRYRLSLGEEKVGDAVFREQRPAENTQHLIHASVKGKRFLDESERTIGYNGNVNLYPHGILAIAPKRFDLKMLLYPFEERLDFPATLVKKCYFAGLQEKVVGIINEYAIMFRGIVDYPANLGRIVLSVALGSEAYRLVTENIVCSFKHIFSCRHFVLGSALLSNHKEGIQQGDTKQPCEIPVTPIKDIASPGFIFNLIHSVDIMDFGVGNVYCDWDVRNNVVLGMHLDSRLGASEPYPIEKSHAERYGRGIKGIELAVNDKLPVYSRILGKSYHVVVFTLIHNRLLSSYLSLITFSKVRQAFCYANN